MDGRGDNNNHRCKDGSVTWEELIEKLLEIFQEDQVNIEQVSELLESYTSNVEDWKKFAKFDKYKYTRNLVHEGNGKFNLMLLCWAEGNISSIHDHSDAHCFVKVLDGGLREVRYHWPEEKTTEDGGMAEMSRMEAKKNDVTYMSDELGLHRVENVSHTNKAVSLHLYSPPFGDCQSFDERTGRVLRCPMTFWSKFGERTKSKSPKHKINNPTAASPVKPAQENGKILTSFSTGQEILLKD